MIGCGCCSRGRPKTSRSSDSSGSAMPVDFGAFTYAAFDLDTAQEAFGAPGAIDRINVVGTPGVKPSVLRDRVAEAVGPTYNVELAADAAESVGQGVRDLLQLLTTVLLGLRGDRCGDRRAARVQHVHDRGGAAHARARVAAGHRREPHPGHRCFGRSRRSWSGWSRRWLACSWGSAWRRCCSPSCRPSASTFPRVRSWWSRER